MTEMMTKINTLWPEIVILGMAFLVMIVGLSPSAKARRFTFYMSAAALVVAGYLVMRGDTLGLEPLSGMAMYLKLAILAIGLLLLLAAAEVPDEAHADLPDDKSFHPSLVSRGEFYGFFLMSLAGAMLCVDADDLIWLFLALELTSLPTYVMVSIARDRIEAPEAGVKYFFLGAFAAAIFLYGFTLLYGATGTTLFVPFGQTAGEGAVTINGVLAEQGIGSLAMLGLILSILGICFKIAAVPMHAYAADVYQGAATPVTAFLAFVPKTAGIVAMIAVLNMVGWPLENQGLDGALFWLIWVLAVATMFLGNTMALRQKNVKRVLAFSSIAHSGYMLVGLLAGPVVAEHSGFHISNGIAAVLFYLVAYGVMNLGAFGVLGILRSKGEECETYDDLRGLVRRHPVLATVMAVCVFSLTGLPPILGFWGKLYLVGAAMSQAQGGQSEWVWLVVLLVMASAIGAVYYLRIIAACFLPDANEETVASPKVPWRIVASVASAVGVVVLSVSSGWLLDAANDAASPKPQSAEPTAEQITDEPTPVVSQLID